MAPSADHSTLQRLQAAPASLDAVRSIARLAHRTRSVVHVVVPRQPRIVEQARAAAREVDVGIAVDLLPATIRVRFDGGSPAVD